MRRSIQISILILGLTMGSLVAHAEAPEPDASPTPSIPWTAGPSIGDLGTVGQISVPKGYRFTGKAGAQTFSELAHNPITGGELGVLIPSRTDDANFFFVTFTFEDVGYVRDDEKEQLDPDALLASLRNNTEQQNKIHEKRGWKPIHVLGWYKQPYYNDRTHNLTWAILGKSEDDPDQVVNYFTRFLGRHGIMSIDLIISQASAARVISEYDSLLAGFSYEGGEKYTEFREGDKLASYGLTALIAGGVGAFAVKSGILAKLWKFLLVGFFALIGLVKRFFFRIKQIFHKEDNVQTSVEPR
jgi:uncharacterized membrane-anchored protein